MNDQELAVGEDDRASRPVFISYASADRAHALKVCKALERRGTACWISVRDVAAGRELSRVDRSGVADRSGGRSGLLGRGQLER